MSISCIEDIVNKEDIPERNILSVQEIQRRAKKVDLMSIAIPFLAAEQASNIIEGYVEKNPCLPQHEKDALLEVAGALYSITKDVDILVTK